MSDLAFAVTGASVEPYAAVPTLLFHLAISDAVDEAVQTIALRCQVRIEPRRRHYAPGEEDALAELFGERDRWGDTLQSLLWANTSSIVPGFRGSIQTDLPVVCTYDFEVATAKYLDALRDGEIPLEFLFSGTVFVRAEGGIQADPVPWRHEASYRLPAAVWREAMDRYFPNSTWIRLRRETFDRLYRFRSRAAQATWEGTIEALLDAAQEPDGVRAGR